jgi:hypothetical protein
MFAKETLTRLLAFSLKSIFQVISIQPHKQKWRGDFACMGVCSGVALWRLWRGDEKKEAVLYGQPLLVCKN